MSCLLGVRQTELAARLGAQEIHGDGADLYALLLALAGAGGGRLAIRINLDKDIHTGPEKAGSCLQTDVAMIQCGT